MIVCTVCRSSRVKPLPYHYIWRNQTWRFHWCRECTHRFIWPLLTATESQAIYTDQYFSATGDWDQETWHKGYLEVESNLRDEARSVLEMIPVHRGRLLEIGCAGGIF